MQPNNMNNGTNGAPSDLPKTTPMNPGGDVVFKDKKSNKGVSVLGILVLDLMAEALLSLNAM